MGVEAEGKALDVASQVIGVSVARACVHPHPHLQPPAPPGPAVSSDLEERARGGPLEKGLRRVIEDARLGSLLIHNDEESQEPLLYNVDLPKCLRSKEAAAGSWVLLLDSQMGTGASALSE